METARARVQAAAAAVQHQAAEDLRGHCDAADCASLCRRINGELESSIDEARAAGVPVACAAGCNFCCHQRVSVQPHEAIALVAHLRTRLAATEAAAIELRIAANARLVDGMTVAEHYAANLACAFLVAGRCAAYEVRPSICASFHSLSRARCEHSFNHPQDIGTPCNSRPVLLEVDTLTDALHAATRAGLAVAGKASAKLELHQAVRALLAEPAAAERWCAGGTL